MTEEIGRKRVWTGVGFGVIPAIVLAFGYLNIHPELFRSVPAGFGGSYDSSFTGIDWDDDEKDNPPIKYLSDKYEAILISTEIVEVTSFWSLWNRPKSKVEFRWEYKVSVVRVFGTNGGLI